MSRHVFRKPQPISLERAYDVLKSPVVTEKSTTNTTYRQYTFYVAQDATKTEVKQAAEKIFKVEVESVNAMVVKGKEKRFRGRLGRRPDRKKMILTLKEGQAIDIGAGI